MQRFDGKQMTSVPDVAYCVEGDLVRIEQQDGMTEPVFVDLHAIHIRLFASEMGLMSGDVDAWTRVATLERRLRVLCERVKELDRRLWSVPVYPPGSANDDPDLWFSDGTALLAEEYMADLPESEGVAVVSTTEAEAFRFSTETERFPKAGGAETQTDSLSRGTGTGQPRDGCGGASSQPGRPLGEERQ